jgi:hypothetical protein
VVGVEQWAENRRLHFAKGRSQREIRRRTAGAKPIDAANNTFVDAMTTTATLAASAAVIGAFIAPAFLPSRARAEAPAPLGPDALAPAMA